VFGDESLGLAHYIIWIVAGITEVLAILTLIPAFFSGGRVDNTDTKGKSLAQKSLVMVVGVFVLLVCILVVLRMW
jgi:uncharacterized membrane protein